MVDIARWASWLMCSRAAYCGGVVACFHYDYSVQRIETGNQNGGQYWWMWASHLGEKSSVAMRRRFLMSLPVDIYYKAKSLILFRLVDLWASRLSKIYISLPYRIKHIGRKPGLSYITSKLNCYFLRSVNAKRYWTNDVTPYVTCQSWLVNKDANEPILSRVSIAFHWQSVWKSFRADFQNVVVEREKKTMDTWGKLFDRSMSWRIWMISKTSEWKV